jgi:FkbM family methyltransferase
MANFWLGTYEREKVEAFHRELSPGSIVYDVGANVGIYTVLACRAVGQSGRVFAFEPVAANLEFLRRNIGVNRFANCEVVPKAVSDKNGTVSFASGGGSCLGKISDHGEYCVPSITLDSFVAEGHPLPGLVKIDVEGAEAAVFEGAKETLAAARPVIFLATHGPEVHERCCSVLRFLGYSLDFLAADEILARPPVLSSRVL